MSGPKEEVIRPAIKKRAIFDRARGAEGAESVAVRADRFINAYWKQVGR